MANKRWEQRGKEHHLLFNPYDDDEEEIVAAALYQNEDGDWQYSSSVSGADEIYTECDDLESAKLSVEEDIIRYYECQVAYYSEMVSKFSEN